MLFWDKIKIRSQRGWRVRELMANQRCFEKKGILFSPDKILKLKEMSPQNESFSQPFSLGSQGFCNQCTNLAIDLRF